MKQIKTIHRTLVLAAGELAAQAVQALPTAFSERSIPDDTIAICVSNEAGSLTTDDLDAALAAIAQLETQAALAAKGWRVARDVELDVIIVIDAVPGADAIVDTWLDLIARQTRQRLGLPIAPLLLWLVPDAAGADTIAACLHSAENNVVRLTRGTYVLGMTTEESMRLKDEDQLIQKTTAVLYTLSASPLRDKLTAMAQDRETFALGSLGVSIWRWNPQAATKRLLTMWLLSVLTQWSAPPATDNFAAHARQWLTDGKYTADELRAHLEANLPAAPQLTAARWRFPWPWRLETLWHSVQQTRAAQTVDTQRIERASAEWTAAARQHVRQSARTWLDGQPQAGVATLVEISLALEATCNTWEESAELRCDQYAQQTQTTLYMLEAIEADWELCSQRWPRATVGSWLKHAIAIWRWPRLVRRYRRMRQLGQQATRVTRQWFNEATQHQIAQAEAQTWQHLAGVVDHLIDQAQEIGDMLASVTAEIETAMPNPPVISADNESHALTEATWQRLYALGQLDAQPEARAAADQIGGLGQQLDTLDETFMPALTAFATTRLAWVADLTPHDLHHVLYPESAALTQWWHLAIASAAPLWRYDEAELAESVRAEAAHGSWLCSASNGDQAALTGGELNALQPVAGIDPHELILLRVRHGISAAAMSRIFEEQ